MFVFLLNYQKSVVSSEQADRGQEVLAHPVFSVRVRKC